MGPLQKYTALMALLLFAAPSGSALAQVREDRGHPSEHGPPYQALRFPEDYGRKDATVKLDDGTKISWYVLDSTILWPRDNTVGDAWTSFNTPTNNKNNPGPTIDRHLSDPILRGAIDLHAHHGPDSYPRYGDAFEVAKLMQERGMRGAVFKNHWQETASIAFLVRKYAVPGTGFLAFGAVCMDTPEGGVNPNAIRYMSDVQGGFGAIVWMPTHDSEHEVQTLKQARPYVRVSDNGKLLPEVFEVLDLIKERNLTLATGHVSADEMMLIVKAARKRGITKIIITHANLGAQYTDPTIDQLQEVVAKGAVVEFVSGQTAQAAIIDKIRKLGPQNVLISSDSGLPGTNHTDALVTAIQRLRTAGFKEADLKRMFQDNPAKAIGLPVL
ncbi:amidohydrolase 2 [Methylocella silvestris BL2]|uniref:Amidohydrolase 2 n=1 Tax=Methylocella silvestris (strain DSM 15510 / CIP 108128 / LMG 27833 / NCIMB 13906 / BL2) TaxID=395965 RepID=B8ER78_METSB|nr:DUF6282 family protein [Methylocella silvestris]ACK50262.1 amidohydrolase 2 [Methylocella silvestris BL2]